MNFLNKTVVFTGLLAIGSLVLAPAAAGEKIGKGEGVDIVAWAGYIERGETDKSYDWVTELREGHRLQGQRQDRRHLGRDGGADERGRLRSGHRLGRRQPAPGRRQARSRRSTPRLIPSWSTVDPRLQNAPWHTVTASTTACPTSGARTC